MSSFGFIKQLINFPRAHAIFVRKLLGSFVEHLLELINNQVCFLKIYLIKQVNGFEYVYSSLTV